MKIRNPLAQQPLEEKAAQYKQDCMKGALAYKSNETMLPLSSVNIDNVEFICGLWRVQDEFNYNISKIRDKQMILGPRIEHKEKTFFEYYKAAILAYNCYGPLTPFFDMVAARYITDKGEYWSYGNSIAQARAFLGIRLYDEHMDLIHAEVCKNRIQNTRK